MEALLRAAAAPGFPGHIALVLSNNPAASGLAHAARYGTEALCIDHRPHGPDRAAHEADIDAALQSRGIGLVCLAGYMRLLTPYLVTRWTGRMLNIHPSLLPAFPGLHTHERALAAGVKLHGCTVHQVTEVMDQGPILAQAAVPVLPSDTPETLAARVLVQEHRLYAAALSAHLHGPAHAACPDEALLHAPLPDTPGSQLPA